MCMSVHACKVCTHMCACVQCVCVCVGGNYGPLVWGFTRQQNRKWLPFRQHVSFVSF